MVEPACAACGSATLPLYRVASGGLECPRCVRSRVPTLPPAPLGKANWRDVLVAAYGGATDG